MQPPQAHGLSANGAPYISEVCLVHKLGMTIGLFRYRQLQAVRS
jgi:hypothetical protein